METFSALLALNGGIHRSPVNSPHKGQWRRALIFSLSCALNKRLTEQSWDWWFETTSRSLWRHCDVTAFFAEIIDFFYVSFSKLQRLHRWCLGMNKLKGSLLSMAWNCIGSLFPIWIQISKPHDVNRKSVNTFSVIILFIWIRVT